LIVFPHTSSQLWSKMEDDILQPV